MLIFAVSLSVGLGLKAVPEALQYVPIDLKNLLATGLLPVAFLAIVMHLLLPKIEGDTAG